MVVFVDGIESPCSSTALSRPTGPRKELTSPPCTLSAPPVSRVVGKEKESVDYANDRGRYSRLKVVGIVVVDDQENPTMWTRFAKIGNFGRGVVLFEVWSRKEGGRPPRWLKSSTALVRPARDRRGTKRREGTSPDAVRDPLVALGDKAPRGSEQRPGRVKGGEEYLKVHLHQDRAQPERSINGW